MDIQSCIDEYLKIVPKIFPTEGRVSGSTFGHLVKYVLFGVFPLLLLCFLIRHFS